ncbi:MAG: hypothetical protein HN975_17395 [Anaerolineae bacterium]|jgi:photosystem II stability/assembly factor-like uncharacterized protein|nr:hypothetical protein [Anaerolineae bacterium]MBT7072655.1 hypothetical protein [Anaerolineae bacterium]MBT7991012.1 hypothetical protein [Anaerolineae bacterium]
MTKRKYIFSVISILLVLLAFSTIALAQEGGFSENFDNVDLSGWELSPGAEVLDGNLHIPPENFVGVPGIWGNMEIHIFVRRTAEGDFALSYGSNENGSYHLVSGMGRIGLQYESMGQLNDLMAVDVEPIPAGEWFEISVQIVGMEHHVLLNGNPVLVEEGSAEAIGGISFETFAETGIEIDSVEIIGEGGGQEDVEPQAPSQSEATQPETGADGGLSSQKWVFTGGPSGGLGYDIRMDPENLDILYVTDAWAGAFKSVDGGENWKPINNGITARVGTSGDGIPVFSLTIDPNNSSRLWAGTQFGGGVYRSDDAGESWQGMSNGILERSLTIRGFTVEPENSNVVYLAGEVSSWEWNGTPLDGIGFDLTKGVIYKSTDAGGSWTRIWYGDNLARYIWVHPEDHNRLYASTGIFDREAANSNPAALEMGGVGILRSRDGGATWEVLEVENGILAEDLFFGSLSMHPQNPDILLGASGSDAYIWALNKDIGAIYRTKNGGDSWERILDLPNASAVEICESNPDVIYAASVSGFYRSDDGGDSWQRQGGTGDLGQTGVALWGPPDIVAGFPIDMQCDLKNPKRIFVNNYGGGNFLSEDGGATWVDASKGYTGAAMHQIIVAKDNPALIYASARSGVFSSIDGGENWQGMARGVARAMEAYAIAVNPEDSAYLVTVIGDAGPLPKISYDGGKTWKEAKPELGEHGFYEWGIMKKMAFSPMQSGRIIGIQAETECPSMVGCAEGHGVIYSSDGGENWHRSGLTEGMATELTFAPDGTAYVSIYPGDLYRSTDGGQNWEMVAQNITSGIEVSDPDMGTPILIALAVDAQNPQKLYAGFTRGGVMLSEDGGATWQASSSGMPPETSIFDFAVDGAHPNTIYAASNDSGVFQSSDGGQTWQTINDGLLIRAGVSLALSDDGTVLYLATTGGGVFRLGTPSSSSTEQTQPELDTAPQTSPEDEQPPALPCLGGLAPVGLVGVLWAWRRRSNYIF